jgi:hypothetical protein
VGVGCRGVASCMLTLYCFWTLWKSKDWVWANHLCIKTQRVCCAKFTYLGQPCSLSEIYQSQIITLAFPLNYSEILLCRFLLQILQCWMLDWIRSLKKQNKRKTEEECSRCIPSSMYVHREYASPVVPSKLSTGPIRLSTCYPYVKTIEREVIAFFLLLRNGGGQVTFIK